jgi:Spore coat assembly protein
MRKPFSHILALTLFLVLNACSNEKEETLTASVQTLEFEPDGGTHTITIESNVEWKLIFQAGQAWCTTSQQDGDGKSSIEITAQTNDLKIQRLVELYVKTKNKSLIIKINQKGQPANKGFYYPILNIETKNRQVINSKDIYVDATFSIAGRNNMGEKTTTLSNGNMQIKGRGNSTWDMPKKPYRIKLESSTAILDMPLSKHWILLANYSDKTLLRNSLAFEISRRMGFTYTPRSQYVDVVLNGDSIGNYLLSEQIRIDKNRLNISSLKPTDNDISGGYLLEVDERMGEPSWFKTQNAEMIFCIQDPENIPDNQKGYITDYIQNIENIIYAKDGINTMNELPKYVDMKSFVDYLLLNELSKNVDGNLRLSTFVFKNKGDDKLYFGPIWDYDLGFGNVNYYGCDKTAGWYASNAAWYQKLFAYPEFQNMVKKRWKELRGDKLKEFDTFIDTNSKQMEMSQKKNFKRWNILNQYVWPNAVVTGSYENEIKYLKNWLFARLTWMDQQLK